MWPFWWKQFLFHQGCQLLRVLWVACKLTANYRDCSSSLSLSLQGKECVCCSFLVFPLIHQLVFHWCFVVLRTSFAFVLRQLLCSLFPFAWGSANSFLFTVFHCFLRPFFDWAEESKKKLSFTCSFEIWRYHLLLTALGKWPTTGTIMII